jgi:hypothetical protein
MEYPTRATVTVDERGVSAEVWFSEAKHLVTFEGEVEVYEAPADI